ncbi:MAG: phosphatidylserine decarboxylase family protein [Desulfobulbaceae bacterium]|nr:phosphatidylserine decarboxylase family protein [Desulfobulbaceae bacterium]
MKTPRVPIAVEGYPFIFFCAFITLVLGFLGFAFAAIIGIIVTGYVLMFFRDPERIGPDDPTAVVAPADGRIILVEKIPDEGFGKEVHKISIFMNIFNVHVNRFPFRGTIESITFKPGKFYAADTERGALHNEYCAITVNTEFGIKYRVVQVAGLIARRIVCWAEKEDTLGTGERYGLIRFGSRVDLYLPLDVSIVVSKGQIVRAGESVLGNFQPAGTQV